MDSELEHGYWSCIKHYKLDQQSGCKHFTGFRHKCSICGSSSDKNCPDMKYCPECGARMDLKDPEED